MAKNTIAAMMVWLASMVFLFAGSATALDEGLWEITAEVEMPGMPMKMPPTTYTQCIKKDQAVPMDEKPGQECKVKDVTTKGNTTSWTVECSNPAGPMIGKGTVSYNGDKMEGSMHMEGQGMTMTSRYKGHRVGACQ